MIIHPCRPIRLVDPHPLALRPLVHPQVHPLLVAPNTTMLPGWKVSPGRAGANGYSIEWPKVLVMVGVTTPRPPDPHPVIKGGTVPYNTPDSTPTVQPKMGVA